MATKKTKTSAPKKAVNTVETEARNVGTMLRKSALAYVGLYVAAYDRVKPIVANTGEKAEKFFGELVEKGEIVEAQAADVAVTAKTRAFAMAAKARQAMPVIANDRVEELENEIAKLNKKVAAKAKSATQAKKVKTQKTTAKKAA
ncbi:hypothetical protein [Robiginitomaculum antarcticum]|uniref:hypothetical protein n=1 Tax=Robiginitomaculum antarcticum TaxID=437507 RepID=UPI000368F496|nr:hypothetical protein [Robiginitomaculum antarcticum]